MCGRSASLLLLALSLFLSPAAHARKKNFFSDSPFGLGFKSGLENKPNTDFVTVNPQTTGSDYSYYFAFEPFFDFGNFVIRGTASLHYHPTVRGSGSDTKGIFAETSNAKSVNYGVEIKLVPIGSQDFTRRAYIFAGIANAVVSAESKRTYSTGSAANAIEKVRGTGQEIRGGVGFEAIFTQNYSFELELGYHALSVNEFGYRSTGNIEGATVNVGETARKTVGRPKGFQQLGPFLSAAFNLNL